MIADEPETGLDPVLRRVVTELMIQVAEDHGAALMLISHNMDTVRRIAHHVVQIGDHAPEVVPGSASSTEGTASQTEERT